MRALDSIGGKRSPTTVPSDEEEAAPRLRRADAHPDAPSRRPISAGRDLGDPFQEESFAVAPFEEEPLELAPETALAHEPEAGREPEPKPKPVTEALPPFLVPQQQEPETVETHTEAAEFVQERDAFETPAADHPAPQHFDEAEEESDEESESYAAEGDDQSLARLMQRFESGLGRKQQAITAAPSALGSVQDAPVQDAQPIGQERVGHRLRSAITDLGKMSAPGH
jgi:hypothetical protein